MGTHDVQQVCLNGHQITDSYYRSPKFRRKYCSTCGAETIHQCPTCNAEIKGDYNVEGVVAVGFQTAVPTHCENCGKPFPWTKVNKKVDKKNIETKRTNNLKFDKKVTFKWLWENIPASLWFKFASILIFIFTLGLYASALPIAKNILKKIPGYKVDLVLSKDTQKDIQNQINSLINSHNERLDKLQVQLLEEEKLGGDHNLIPSYREYHQKAAQRIRDIIKSENDNFQSEIKALKVFLGE